MKVYVCILIIWMMSVYGCGSVKKTWTIETQEEWTLNSAQQSNLEFKEGKVIPTASEAVFQSVLKRYPVKRSTSAGLSRPIWS